MLPPSKSSPGKRSAIRGSLGFKPGNDGGKKKCTGMAEERKTSTEMATKRKRQKPLKRN